MSQERSAEWLQGAVESHINTCNLITSITSTTASHPARQGLMAAGNELHNQLDRYRRLLAEAEAREAAEPDLGTSAPTRTGTIQVTLRAGGAGKPLEYADEAPSAAEVIAAAERAVLQLTPTNRGDGCYCPHYVDINQFGHGESCKVANNTLAAIAKWKEANNA